MNYYLFKPYDSKKGSFVVRIQKNEEKFFDELCFNLSQDSEEIPVDISKIKQSNTGRFCILTLKELKGNYIDSLSHRFGI